MIYHAYSQSPKSIRSKLKLKGLDADALEESESIEIWDWYTSQLGLKSEEKIAVQSLKVADLSIQFSRDYMRRSMGGVLQVSDNTSALARFNDEKAWVEYVLTRVIPSTKSNQSVLIRGIMKSVHSEWAYKQHEGSHDGIVDFKLEEEGRTTRDFMRIRSMRDVHFDREWHELKVGENFEVTLAK